MSSRGVYVLLRPAIVFCIHKPLVNVEFVLAQLVQKTYYGSVNMKQDYIRL
jgi:hypothetical protein